LTDAGQFHAAKEQDDAEDRHGEESEQGGHRVGEEERPDQDKDAKDHQRRHRTDAPDVKKYQVVVVNAPARR